jgi:hypothetical protein
MPSIYEVPVNMQRQGLDAAILRKMGIPVGETPAMKPWRNFLEKQRNATREVHVALVGKYDLQDAYKSIRESLNLAGIYNDVKVKIHFTNSEDITPDNVAEKLKGQVRERVKADRSAVLLDMTRDQARAYRESFIGRREELLIEETRTLNGRTWYTGHTARYVEGAAEAAGGLSLRPGSLVRGRFAGFIPGTDVLRMEIEEAEQSAY